MIDFQIQRCTRRCAKSDRELKAGELFYSVLSADGSQVVRQDYAADTWEGPPDGAIGWWKAKMPDTGGGKVQWAPNDVLVECFERLADVPEKTDVRYLLGLLMIRRRILRLEESKQDDLGREVLVVYCGRNENTYEVVAVEPQRERLAEVKEELTSLLFAEVQ